MVLKLLMGQISLRLPEEDVAFLSFIAKKKAIPIATLYKEITHGFFKQWKLETIIQEYSSGSIGMKRAWKLTGMSFPEFLHALENSKIEPPHTELMELKSEARAKQLGEKDFFKEGVDRKRKTPEITIEED